MSGYVCWLLDGKDREQLLELIPPEFANVYAHHITLVYDVHHAFPLPTTTEGKIVGEIMDAGVQTLVVEIDGTTIRPDGKTFHITWSLEDGKFPSNSNDILTKGWWPLPIPIDIKLIPAYVGKEP